MVFFLHFSRLPKYPAAASEAFSFPAKLPQQKLPSVGTLWCPLTPEHGFPRLQWNRSRALPLGLLPVYQNPEK